MNDGKYIVGSGYIGGDRQREDFFKLWIRNLERNADFNPRHLFVVCARGQSPADERPWMTKVKIAGDLGHICRNDSQRHQIEGWPAALMTLMLIAYNDERDLIFIEQDCLPFGGFVSQLFSEMRDGVGCIMGSLSTQPCAQSLMLIRHWFIPELVHGYLGKKIKERKLQGEQAFEQMEKEMNGKFQRFSFGYDRDRPPDGFESMKGKVWYAQQISMDELATLKQLGMI